MSEKPPVIILVVSKSFGEVDWILPVLTLFKEQHPEWEIITLFSHKVIYDFLTLNTTLLAQFSQVSSLNIVPQELALFFQENVAPEQVKIILKDYNEDQYSPYKTEVERYCPSALVVSYPHSNHIFSNRGTDGLRICPDPDAYSVHDLFLLCSEHDIPYWSRYVDVGKIRTFGYPRYDSWWMKRILSGPNLRESEEFRRAQQFEKVFFYVSRGAHPVYLNQGDYEYLLRSTLEETLRYEDGLLLIKPHPRQDVEDLHRVLSDYDPQRWMVSGLHLMELASLADVVISGWSSGILDGLAVGKPVIEFWRFSGMDPDCRVSSDGRPSTIYRELGLVRAAETREELAALLADAISDPEGPAWQVQKRAFGRYCKEIDNASGSIAACLFDEVARKQAGLALPATGQPPTGLIDAMIDFVTGLAEDGEEERVGQWLEFLIAQFPEEPHVLNNLGVFLFNRGDSVGAVDCLVKSVKHEPRYQEATMNLVQILLFLGREDDAADIVVSFYRQTSGTGPRAAFLQALREQLGEEPFGRMQERLVALHGPASAA